MVVIEFGVIAFINKRIKWNRNFNNEGFHGLPVINENIGFTVQHAIEIGTATKEVTSDYLVTNNFGMGIWDVVSLFRH